MKTLKVLKSELDIRDEEQRAYYEGYKTATEQMLNDIVNSETTSVEVIEKWLQDILY